MFWKLVAAFAIVYVIWGSTYLGIRIGVETIPPFLMAGLRQTTAGLLLYAWLRWRGAPRHRNHAYSSKPAVVCRSPAIRNGGIVSTPMRMPRYVEPQMTY